jgi:hypothetical protein
MKKAKNRLHRDSGQKAALNSEPESYTEIDQQPEGYDESTKD